MDDRKYVDAVAQDLAQRSADVALKIANVYVFPYSLLSAITSSSSLCSLTPIDLSLVARCSWISRSMLQS